MKTKKSFRAIITLCVFVLISTFAITVYASQIKQSVEPASFPCGKCKGNKTITDFYGRKITCPHCLGSGNEPSQKQTKLTATPFPDTSKRCKVCSGQKGWNTTYGWKTCDHCLGTGKEPNK